MGAGDLNHRQFAQQIDLYTGGLHVSPHICAHHSNELGYEQVSNQWIYLQYIMYTQQAYTYTYIKAIRIITNT